MNYQLRFEGFGLDEELREKLMQCVRDFVLRIGPDHLLEIAVRALLGAILENFDSSINIKTLKESLNPLTKFALGLKKIDLPTITNWNII